MSSGALINITLPPGLQFRQIAMDGVRFSPANYECQPLINFNPRNPSFRRAIAEAETVYLHDASAALASWHELARLADTDAVNEGALARPECGQLIRVLF